MVPRSALPYVALICLGIAFVLFALVGLTASDETYTHDIERVAASEVPDDARRVAFDDLSTRGREAFLAALDAPDGRVTVSEAAPEFSYSHATQEYYVEYDSDWYRLRVWGGSGGWVSDLDVVVLSPVLVLGVVAIVVGSLDLYRHEYSDG